MIPFFQFWAIVNSLNSPIYKVRYSNKDQNHKTLLKTHIIVQWSQVYKYIYRITFSLLVYKKLHSGKNGQIRLPNGIFEFFLNKINPFREKLTHFGSFLNLDHLLIRILKFLDENWLNIPWLDTSWLNTKVSAILMKYWVARNSLT